MEQFEQDNNPKARPSKLVYLMTFMSAIGGYLFGYNTGVISGSILILTNQWNLKDKWQELIVSSAIAGATLFSIFGGILNQKFGRKPVILGSSVCFVLGALIMAFCDSRGVLVLGRFTVGAAMGMSSATIPAYVCEASPPKGRGALITVFQLMITFGFLVAGIFNASFSYLREEISWRLMLGVAGFPAIFQFIGFLYMPESPRWEATNGKPDKAKEILEQLNNSKEEADKEFSEIMRDHEANQQALEELGGRNALVTILKTARFRRALIVGCSTHMFAQLSGINTVMYYSGSIIKMAGEEDETIQMWIIVGIYAVNFFCTFIGMYLVDKIGRRKLLLLSVAGCVISLIFLGSSFFAISKTSAIVRYNPMLDQTHSTCLQYKDCDSCSYDVNCGYCFQSINKTSLGSCAPVNAENRRYSKIGACSVNGVAKWEGEEETKFSWNYGFCPTDFGFLPIIGMVLYLFFFSTGLGPMPWTINAEIYPNWARSSGNAVSCAFHWLFNMIISVTFLTLARAISRQGAFFLYSGLTTVGLALFFLLIPETKNMSMEHVENIFAHGWLQCNKSKKKPQEDRK